MEKDGEGVIGDNAVSHDTGNGVGGFGRVFWGILSY